MTLAACELARDVVQVQGPDAIGFVQGQISQDITRLGVAESAFSFLLEPQGKVVAWGKITRSADDTVLFDVDAGHGDAVIARLNRFKLRTKASIELLPVRLVALRGELGPVITSADVTASPFEWPGFAGCDLIGRAPHVALPHVEITLAEYESHRIAVGVPRLGHELDGSTIPGEMGADIVERSVSFTKGCYTGQELVARVDSRGNNTPRRLRRVHFDAPVEAGAEVLVDGTAAGAVTSSAPAPAGGGWVALALIRRAAADATSCQAGGATGEFL